MEGGGGPRTESGGIGEGGNLRGVSHSAGKHMVSTLYCGPAAARRGGTDRGDIPFNHTMKRMIKLCLVQAENHY